MFTLLRFVHRYSHLIEQILKSLLPFLTLNNSSQSLQRLLYFKWKFLLALHAFLFILLRFVGRSSHLIGKLLNELLLFLTLNISSQSFYAQLLHFKWEIPETLRGCLLSYENSHIATDIFRTIFEGVIALFDLEYFITDDCTRTPHTF